jgi:type 1 fimbriae regulatory protein FimB/type 1 fimbriae regulatory protein FimE
MTNSHLKPVTPNSEIRTVAPRRPKNSDVRTREHLTPSEIEKLIEAARGNRNGHRDAIMILIAYRHGFRAVELVDLRWDQIDFRGAVLHARRVKNGMPSTHPIQGDELRALRRLQRESEASPFVFVSERGSPFTTAGFAELANPGGYLLATSPPLLSFLGIAELRALVVLTKAFRPKLKFLQVVFREPRNHEHR